MAANAIQQQQQQQQQCEKISTAATATDLLGNMKVCDNLEAA